MKKQFPIVKKAPIFIAVSLAIIVIGLCFFGYRWIAHGIGKTLNLTVDFTGGTIMSVNLNETFQESDVKGVIEGLGITDVSVNKITSSDTDELTVAEIRFKEESASKLADNQNELRDKINEALKAKYPNLDTSGSNNTIESVGATISREYVESALASVLLAAAAILVYVSWRFDSDVKNAKRTRWINTVILVAALILFYNFKENFTVVAVTTLVAIAGILFTSIRNRMFSGLSAVIALLHDVLIMFAFMEILYVPLGNPFIAVALTIIGYSINNTIVIYDRIRELSGRVAAKDLDRANVANDAINQMLGRTIKTSVTTLITAVAIYVLGVDAVKEFALPMIVGLVAGTYSSIFWASPVWAVWQKNLDGKRRAKLSAEKTA